MTVKQAVKENKMISIILGVLASALMAWGIWVTDASYQTKYGGKLLEAQREMAVLKQDATMKVMCDDIFELKKSDGFLVSEIKDLRETGHQNYQEMLKILLNIQKHIKE